MAILEFAKGKEDSEVSALIDETISALNQGGSIVKLSEGSGGAYLVKELSGKNISIFKPTDEEPRDDSGALKRGFSVGEGAIREACAYLLDHNGFLGVLPTAMVKFGGVLPAGLVHFQGKKGSLQRFVKNEGGCDDFGSSIFPAEDIHKISVIDIRLANADRHAGNILLSRIDGKVKLHPIDHGYCIPSTFEDCTFEWLSWAQSKQPYNENISAYIESLDANEDIELLETHGIHLPLECKHVLQISALLLKEGTVLGLSPYEIGKQMCRGFQDDEKCEIEHVAEKAQQAGGSLLDEINLDAILLGNRGQLCPLLEYGSCTKKVCKFAHMDEDVRVSVYPRGHDIKNHKTKLCPTKMRGRWCRYGVACPMAHDSRELRKNNSKIVPCYLYLNTGTCYYLEDPTAGECPYLHHSDTVD